MPEGELDVLRAIAGSKDDRAVVMLNQNRYRPDVNFPDGELYASYIAAIEATVESVGGKILWRTAVQGLAIGCSHDRCDEVLAVWYPSHSAFLHLPKAERGKEMFRLRKLCVENAVIHRCSDASFPFTYSGEV